MSLLFEIKQVPQSYRKFNKGISSFLFILFTSFVLFFFFYYYYLNIFYLLFSLKKKKQALALDPENNKLLFRRAVANRNLGNYNDALKDLRVAEKKEPENKAIKAEIARSNAEIEKQKAKERRMAKAMFGGSD